MKVLATLLIVISLHACYMPASRNWYSFAGSFFGRKDFTDRLMSSGFYIVTLPVQLGAVIVDIPFSVIEFFIGWTPFKDPLLSLQDLDQLPLYYRAQDGTLWTLDTDSSSYNSLYLKKEREGVIHTVYLARKFDGSSLRLGEVDCQSQETTHLCR